jgi:predicted DNA-binding transcriptional regulator AlpA
MYGCGQSTVKHWAAAGRIPKPVVQRTKYTRWLLSEINADIRGMRHAEREEQVAHGNL